MLSRYETDDHTYPVMGELVSRDVFNVLGLEPAQGRFFVAEEGETLGTHPVVVLGQAFWQTRFGADPGIVGRSIRVGGRLFTVVGLVFLIACVNLAGFLLARAADRKKKIALPLALGARRWALVRQLLVATLVLGFMGGAAGLLVATWVLRLLVGFQPPIPFPVNFQFELDGTVLAFSALVSTGAGIFFGLIPALQATNPDVAATLKSEGGSVTGTRRKLTLRNGLIVAQVTLSMVLLLGAGLFVRSLYSAQEMEIGLGARDGESPGSCGA
jgi:predicted lysophospholipase L1 biosynthesis ABC-type transport system permease subunit